MYRCYFIFEARSFDLKLGLDRIENRFKISFKRYALKERERERESSAYGSVNGIHHFDFETCYELFPPSLETI